MSCDAHQRQRLERLEAEMRIWRGLFALLALGSAALLTLRGLPRTLAQSEDKQAEDQQSNQEGADPGVRPLLQPKPEKKELRIIEADEFILVNNAGRQCAWLKVGEDNAPMLQLKHAGVHATLRLSGGFPGLSCGTKEGMSWIGVGTDGPNVSFKGKDRKSGAWLGVQQDLTVALRLLGETLKGGVHIRVQPDGSPGLELADPQGKTVGKLP